jgi:nicotinate-nucleotide adenylyltransferase
MIFGRTRFGQRSVKRGSFVRIGLFGGTFNPIHLGHLRAAVEVRERFELDRLLLIPSSRPPHKVDHDLASAEDRLEMVRLAVEGVPSLEVSDVELARPGRSYTIETLHYFQDKSGPEGEIYFIIGHDAFSDITTWKSYKELFSAAHFIVMTRPGSSMASLEEFIHTKVSAGFQYDPAYNRYTHDRLCAICCVDITHLDISSTKIRDSIRKGRSVRFFVSDRVGDYIEKTGLYR